MTQNPKQPNKRRATTPKPDLSAGPDLSDESLDQLANVTPADIIAATSLWDSKAPKTMKGLLQAKVIEEKQPNE